MCCHCRCGIRYLFQVWYHLIPNVLSLQMWYQVILISYCHYRLYSFHVVIIGVVSGYTHSMLSLEVLYQVILISYCHYRCGTRLYSFYVVITGVVPGNAHSMLSLQVWYQVISMLLLHVWYQLRLIPCCHYRCGTR